MVWAPANAIWQFDLSNRGLSERDARYGLSGVFLSENAWLQLVDPKMSFAENANNLYLEAGNRAYNSNNLGDGDGYYFDPTPNLWHQPAAATCLDLQTASLSTEKL